MRVAALLLVVGLVAGCQFFAGVDEYAFADGDGGASAGGQGGGLLRAPHSDALGSGPTSAGGAGGAPTCDPAPAWCDGDWVVACEGGRVAHLQRCTDACVDGACEDGLVSRFAFEGDASDGVGGLVGAVVAPATANGSLDLSLGGHVELGPGDLHVGFPVSLAAWVKVSPAAVGTVAVIATDTPTSAYAGVWVTINTAGNTVNTGFGDAQGAGPNDRFGFASSTGFPNGVWVHVAAVWHGPDDAELYLDGQPVVVASSGGATALAFTDDGPAMIGHATWGGAGYPFRGEIDEVRVYDRALTPNDVSRISGGGL